MHDDDVTRAEEIIQQRLTHLGRYKIGAFQFGLCGLLFTFSIAPLLIWLVFLAWPAISRSLPASSVAPTLAKQQQLTADRETPLIQEAALSVAIAWIISGVAAFAAVRSLGWKNVRYAAFMACNVFVFVVFVALILALFTGSGISSVAGARSRDLFVVYAIPMGITVLIGAVLGWKVAEQE